MHALEKHLSEEADAAGMQKYFEASCFKRKVENLWSTISCVQLKRLKSLNFGGPSSGKLFFIFANTENFMSRVSG